LSDTIYLHEVTNRRDMRVSLIMDAAEVRAMADIASAAIDGCVLTEGDVESVVIGNAENVYKWATKAADTLEFTAGAKPDDDQE
jgi:hypothetical protein